MSKTNPIDPNVPAGSEDPKLGDNRIRNLAAAIAEALAVNHYMGTDGGAGTGYNEDAAGEHRVITLRVESAPSVEANKGYVYAKDVSGKAELFYKDEDGNEIQITSGGILNSCNLSGNQSVAGVKTFANQIISSLADGTKPIAVTSTTKCDNLNADKIDRYDVSAYSGGESYTFPGGLIIKMGSDYSTSDNEQTFSFGSAFPHAAVSISITMEDYTGTYPLTITSLSASSFKINRNDEMQGSIKFYWIVIGY